MNNDWLQPRWPLADDVGAVMTTRRGGVSLAPYDTLDLGLRVGDDGSAVSTNRRIFASAIGAEPVFLHQVHGGRVVRLDRDHTGRRDEDVVEADAAFTTLPGIACTIQVADCMPVLLAARGGRVVGAAHAGWRGVVAGVIENTVAVMCDSAGIAASELCAWLGPCIGPDAFEVGADVVNALPGDADHVVEAPRPDGQMRWRADLPAIVRGRLARLGVMASEEPTACTVSDPLRFFSYRRDGRTGRHAAAVWIRSAARQRLDRQG